MAIPKYSNGGASLSLLGPSEPERELERSSAIAAASRARVALVRRHYEAAAAVRLPSAASLAASRGAGFAAEDEDDWRGQCGEDNVGDTCNCDRGQGSKCNCMKLLNGKDEPAYSCAIGCGAVGEHCTNSDGLLGNCSMLKTSTAEHMACHSRPSEIGCSGGADLGKTCHGGLFCITEPCNCAKDESDATAKFMCIPGCHLVGANCTTPTGDHGKCELHRGEENNVTAARCIPSDVIGTGHFFSLCKDDTHLGAACEGCPSGNYCNCGKKTSGDVVVYGCLHGCQEDCNIGGGNGNTKGVCEMTKFVDGADTYEIKTCAEAATCRDEASVGNACNGCKTGVCNCAKFVHGNVTNYMCVDGCREDCKIGGRNGTKGVCQMTKFEDGADAYEIKTCSSEVACRDEASIGNACSGCQTGVCNCAKFVHGKGTNYMCMDGCREKHCTLSEGEPGECKMYEHKGEDPESKDKINIKGMFCLPLQGDPDCQNESTLGMECSHKCESPPCNCGKADIAFGVFYGCMRGCQSGCTLHGTEAPGHCELHVENRTHEKEHPKKNHTNASSNSSNSSESSEHDQGPPGLYTSKNCMPYPVVNCSGDAHLGSVCGGGPLCIRQPCNCAKDVVNDVAHYWCYTGCGPIGATCVIVETQEVGACAEKVVGSTATTTCVGIGLNGKASDANNSNSNSGALRDGFSLSTILVARAKE